MPRNTLLSLTLPARRARAFTLVELLVVITIIAILAALLVAGATAAMRRARFTRIKLEVDGVTQGVEDYKNKYGGDYPPSAMTNPSASSMQAFSVPATPTTVANDLKRHFQKVAPRLREPEALIRGLAGFDMTTINGTTSDGGSILIGGMTPAEALVFYLNGFSSDPKAPITGSGGPAYIKADNNDINGGAEGRQPVFPFEVSRLGPRDDSGNFAGRSIEFQLASSGPTYRINFWQYYPPNSDQPLVYFDTSRPLMDVEPPSNYPLPHVHAIKQLATDATSASNALRYANEGKFQILHCGLDDDWGNFDSVSIVVNVNPSQMLLYPNGPFTLELADTVTNFTTGTLEDAQP